MNEITKDILLIFLDKTNWVSYFDKYILKYMDFFELTLLRQYHIKFVDLETRVSFIKNSSINIYDLILLQIKNNPSILQNFDSLYEEFYLDLFKIGVDISDIDFEILIKVIEIEPEVIKLLTKINSEKYLIILDKFEKYSNYLPDISEKYITKTILTMYLNKINWLNLLLKYLPQYLEHFEIFLKDKNNISFKDFSNEIYFNKYITNNIYEINHKNIQYFRIFNFDKNEYCAICRYSQVITKHYCLTLHNDGICMKCYSQIKKTIPICCFCRSNLIDLF
jgi:hypothetical protein